MALSLALASKSNSGQSQIANCTHVWTIHNFSFYCSENKELRSETFSAATIDDLKWHFSIKFENIQAQKHLRVNFNVTKSLRTEASAQCRFLILPFKNQKPFHFGQFDKSSMKYVNSICVPLAGLLKNYDDIISNNQLQIFCEISVCDFSNHQTVTGVDIPRSRLSDDYKLLFENEKYSDVILAAEGKEFKAHKVILCARSSVFQAMFDSEMDESKNNRVEIIDISSEVLRELLRFIYADEVMDLKKIAADLLVAADKYAVLRLKAMCEKELCSKLLIDNVLQSLMVADRHNATQLKTKAIRFFKMHATQVMTRPEWKDVVQLPHLIDELLRA